MIILWCYHTVKRHVIFLCKTICYIDDVTFLIYTIKVTSHPLYFESLSSTWRSHSMESKDTLKKPIYKRWWFWLVIVLLVFGMCNGKNNSRKTSESNKGNNNPSSTTAPTVKAKPTIALATPTPQPTKDTALSEDNFISDHSYEIVAAAKLTLDNFITGYDISLAPQLWTIAKFDSTNTVIGITDIKYNGVVGKYVYVGTLQLDESGKVVSATPHYVEVNGTVLGDDGYCKDVFATIAALSGKK